MDDQHLRVLDPSCPVEWSHPLNTGLVGCWMVPPNSGWRGGLTLRDLVRGGHVAQDGTLTNGPTWQGSRGRPGGYGSLSFDGVSSHVLATSPSASLNGMTGITVSFWWRIESRRDYHVPMAKGAYNTGYEFYYDTGGPGLAWNCKTAGGTAEARVSSVHPLGRWVHSVGVYDGTTSLKMYQDGLSIASAMGFGTPSGAVSAPGTLYVGTDTGSTSYLLGLLDDLRIYSRGMSAADVYALYDQSRRGHPDTLRWLSSRAFFLPPAGGINISGTVYTDEGSTPMGSGRTVAVSVNGAAAAATTITAVGGTYTLAGVTAASGAVLTVYLQGNTELGVRVTVSDGNNLASADIYQDTLIIAKGNAANPTKSNLNTSDANGASGITGIYSCSSFDLTLASGKHFYVTAGTTFPASLGSLTVYGDLHNHGTWATPAPSSTNLYGTGSRTFLPGSGATGYITITGGYYTLQGDLVVDQSNGLTVDGSGTLDVSTSNYNVTLGTGAEMDCANGTFVCHSGTVTSNQTDSSGSTYFAGSITFYNLSVIGTVTTGVTFLLPCTLTVNGLLTMHGSSGHLLSLTSRTPGAQYSINIAGTQALSYLNVTDCNATGTTAAAGSTSTDGTGNTNWTFGGGSSLSRTATDALSSSESLSRSQTLLRLITDSLSSSESPARVAAEVRTSSDSLSSSESLVRVAGESRSASDALTLAESVVRAFVGARAAIDALVSSDVGVRTSAAVRSTADAISSIESAVRVFTGFRTAVDSLSLAESPTRAFTGSRTTIDALSLSESTVKVFVGARLASDALSVAESLARAFAGSRTTIDALTVSESVEALSGKLATATDSLSSSESLARAFAGERSGADGLALAESAVRALVLICTTADGLTSSESLARLHVVARSASDSLSWVDSADATSAGKVRSAADGLVVAGAVTRVFAGSRATSDALAAALAAVGTVSTLTSPDYLIGKVTVCSLVSGVVTVQPLVSGTLTVNPR